MRRGRNLDRRSRELCQELRMVMTEVFVGKREGLGLRSTMVRLK